MCKQASGCQFPFISSENRLASHVAKHSLLLYSSEIKDGALKMKPVALLSSQTTAAQPFTVCSKLPGCFATALTSSPGLGRGQVCHRDTYSVQDREEWSLQPTLPSTHHTPCLWIFSCYSGLRGSLPKQQRLASTSSVVPLA